MNLSTTSIIAAASASLLLAAQAQTITSPNWKQSNAITNLRVAANLSLAAGMDATETNLYNQNITGTFGNAAGETSGGDGKLWNTSSKVPGAYTIISQSSRPVKRIGMVVELRPEYLDDYRRLHADGHPGVRHLLSKKLRR